MTKKLLLITALVAGVLAFLAGPASAQYPPAPTASVDDTSVLAGGVVNITGEGCEGDDTVDVNLEGELIGTLPVAADGSFGGAVTIPSDTPPGTYTLDAVCGSTVLTIEITVSAAGVTPTGGTGTGSGPLARTGSSIDGLLKAGGGLLVAGAAAVLFATKRRTASA